MELEVSNRVRCTGTGKGGEEKILCFVFAGISTIARAPWTHDPLTLTARTNNDICWEPRVLDCNPEHRRGATGENANEMRNFV